ALYAHAPATATRCATPGSTPRASEATVHTATAPSAARRSVRGVRSPATTGLSSRPTATSRAASIQSLDQPTESCPAPTATATSTTVAVGEPRAAASAVARPVTTTAGAAWLARTSAPTRPPASPATRPTVRRAPGPVVRPLDVPAEVMGRT